MKATLLDTVTGKKAVVDGVRAWDFAEGDYSCSCNRARHFGNESRCNSKRYIIVEATPDAKDLAEMEVQYSIAELNQGCTKYRLVHQGRRMISGVEQIFDPTS